MPHLPPGNEAKALAKLVDDMLRQLGSSAGAPPPKKNIAIKTSLFDRCIELCRGGALPSPDSKIRTLHHFSCTGGTLIAKCLASMPNTLVLNEIDPLSRMQFKPDSPSFHPTDFTALVRMGDHGASDKVLVEMFIGQLRSLCGRMILEGRRLLLRDHSHGQFLCPSEPDSSRTLLNVVRSEFATASAVTVRDPLDSFLSMRDLGWISFGPASLDEYARRYHLFLDAHVGLPIFKYEHFLVDPKPVMRQLCTQLELPFNDLFEHTFDAFKFSGDSGRSSGVIAPRPRREHAPELASEAAQSPQYLTLCQRLGYSPVGKVSNTTTRPARSRTKAKK
jgi:hypothetical protein